VRQAGRDARPRTTAGEGLLPALSPQSHDTSRGSKTERGARHALNPWQQQVSGGAVLVKLSPYPAVKIVYSHADALPPCSAPFDPSRPTSGSGYDSHVPHLLKKSKKGGYKIDRRTGIRLDRVRAPLTPVPARAFSGLRADKARAQAPQAMSTNLVIPRALEAWMLQPTSCGPAFHDSRHALHGSRPFTANLRTVHP